MNVVILAGGAGSRLSEETELRPKPLVEIGGRPIIWHIMKHYSFFGFREFLIALGYKGEMLKKYFLDYYNLTGDLTIELSKGVVERTEAGQDDWTIRLSDTGQLTPTGGRVRRLKRFLDAGTFMVTYGDGVANIDLRALLDFHKKQHRIATVTAVRPPARFGGLSFNGDLVAAFTEKPQAGEGWINGGYLVFEPGIFDYLDDNSGLEADALERLASDGQLAAYRHDGFWQCMDTLRDKHLLEQYWQSGDVPWKVWT